MQEVLGGTDVDRIARATPLQLLELDDQLEAIAASSSEPPVAVDEFRVSPSLRANLHDWGLATALLVAHSVVVPDPIDAAYFAHEQLGFISGFTASALIKRQYSSIESNALVSELSTMLRKLLEDDLASERGIGELRLRLRSAVTLLDVWAELFEEGIMVAVPWRSGRAAGLLPLAPDNTTSDLNSALGVAQIFADREPSANLSESTLWHVEFNIRMTHALSGNGQLLPATEREWRYLDHALGHDPDTDERAMAMVVAADLPVFANISAREVLAIRRDSEEFEDWRRSLRSICRLIPATLTPGMTGFNVAAREVLRDELQPQLRRLTQSTWITRAKTDMSKELATIAFGAAGLAGLSEVVTVSPATFAALPVAAATRLAVAAFLGARRRDTTVIARLARKTPPF